MESSLEFLQIQGIHSCKKHFEKCDEPYIETLVLKIDFSAEVLWVKEYGTPGDDIGRCLTVTGEWPVEIQVDPETPIKNFLSHVQRKNSQT